MPKDKISLKNEQIQNRTILYTYQTKNLKLDHNVHVSNGKSKKLEITNKYYKQKNKIPLK